jgi:hypothetical protein
MKKVVCRFSILLFFYNSAALGMADPPLAPEICSFLKSQELDTSQPASCFELTEASTHATYVDLNNDSTKELIFSQYSRSCGDFYWVFRIGKSAKWENIGSWCGCEGGSYTVKSTSHSGYKDIYTCGFSGIYDGMEYTGVRQ